MTSQSVSVPVANIALTLDQVIEAVRQLDPDSRVRVAQELLTTHLDHKLDALIRHLAEREPADDISDDEINAEVRALRRQARD